MFILNNFQEVLTKIYQHLIVSGLSLFFGCLIAIPLGIVVSKREKLSQLVISIASVLQTIPSLALLAMIVPILGVGRIPAIVALCIYSLLPVLRNTILGMNAVDKSILDAAKGMGLSPLQLLYKVHVPLAFNVMMSGVRLSAIYVLAWTTLASYIGAGGLGDYIFSGLNNYNLELLIVGTLPIMILALIIDQILDIVERKYSPKTHSQIVEANR